jgi:hypothetical protein
MGKIFVSFIGFIMKGTRLPASEGSNSYKKHEKNM